MCINMGWSLEGMIHKTRTARSCPPRRPSPRTPPHTSSLFAFPASPILCRKLCLCKLFTFTPLVGLYGVKDMCVRVRHTSRPIPTLRMLALFSGMELIQLFYPESYKYLRLILTQNMIVPRHRAIFSRVK